ncbi:hypothetical protein [Rhodanobacter sp. C05]|nr:hypothetical protein [Rhodanobacter sp. C05]
MDHLIMRACIAVMSVDAANSAARPVDPLRVVASTVDQDRHSTRLGSPTN